MEVDALLSTIKLVRFPIASSGHAGEVSQLEYGVCNSVELCHCARDHSVCTTQTRPKQDQSGPTSKASVESFQLYHSYSLF